MGNCSNQDLSLFDRSTSSHNLTPLSSRERGFIIDITFGIIAMMLSQRCPTQDLYPLITFISFNLDLEWDATSVNTKNNCDLPGKHSIRYTASLKAVSVFFFLLQKSPPVPHLINGLHEIFENGNTTASWMLCCIVNSYDDAMRALGIKCLAAYLHATLSSSASTVDAPVDSPDAATSQKEGATSRISKYVGTGFGVITQSARELSNLISGRFNVKVIYKLLWHLLKCHRGGLGDASNAALMYLLVDDGSAASSSYKLTDILVSSSELLGGFLLYAEGLDSGLSKGATTLARQCIRNTHGVSMVLRLLRFLSTEQKERWLFDILALILASPNGVNMFLTCDDWQPCLFQLVAEVVEEINGDNNDTEIAAGLRQTQGNHTDGPSIDGNRSQIDRKQSPKPSEQSLDTKAALPEHPTNASVAVDIQTLSKPSVRTRYDLSLKLYSTLLGHRVRQGDEKVSQFSFFHCAVIVNFFNDFVI